MPKPTRTPKYCHHKARNLAYVHLDGKDHYLGRYGSPESWEKYHRLVAEHLSRPTGAPPPAEASAAPLTVVELLDAYWEHAKAYYRLADGSPSMEQKNIQAALRTVRALYARTPAAAFDQLALGAVQTALVESKKLARPTINARINIIRRAFRWAASKKLITGSQVHDLDTVPGLKANRTTAREPDPVKPVSVEVVEATLPFLPPAVAAMASVQLLTACRLGEVVVMRGRDLTPGETWAYRPGSHKNAWRGHSRFIALGPKAIEVIKPFLKEDPAAYLFDPRETIEAVRERRAQARKSKPTPSERKRRARRKLPPWKVGDHYDRRSYRQAVERACALAFPHPKETELLAAIAAAGNGQKRVARQALADWRKGNAELLDDWRKAHRWTPLQLRHTSATLIRARFDLDAAAVILGHADPKTTLRYAEPDVEGARKIMREVG
jgi:integrase